MIQEYLSQPAILALVKITAMLLIVLAVTPFIKQPKLRATLWLVGILATPIIFALATTKPLLTITTNTPKTTTPIQVELSQSPSTETSTNAPQSPITQPQITNTPPNIIPTKNNTQTPTPEITAPTTPTKINWLKILYITGSALTILPFLLSTIRAYFIKKSPATGKPIKNWNQLAKTQPNHAKLYFTHKETAPCAHGIIFQKILIPENSTQWEDRRINSVLSHEIAHHQRHDPLTRLLSTLIKSVFWFHPLIWLAHRNLIQAQEECCDQIALSTGLNAEDYAEDLLFAATLSESKFSQNLAMAKWSQLGQRINKIISGKTQPPVSMKTNLTILALAAGTAFALATTGVVTQTNEDNQVTSEQTVKGITKANLGDNLTFNFKDLPEHQALEINFTVQLLGPWDGNGFHRWGPDRLLCKLDQKTSLLDATFNNCHLIWPGNLWQSFPDPHHPQQNDYRKADQYLHHGGEAASAIASLNFAWGEHKSLDSSYTLTYIAKHTGDAANIEFSTIWNEAEENVTTYRVKDLTIKTLQHAPKVTPAQVEQAWLTMFSGDAIASQKAWATIFTAHPEKFIKRAKSLVSADPERINYIISKLKTGHTPTTAISREVFVSPSNPDAANIHERISLLRELALSKDVWITDAQKFWTKSGGNAQTRAIRKALSTTMKQGPATIRAKMKITSYLKMLNTPESNKIAAQFDKTYTKPDNRDHTKAKTLAKIHNQARADTVDKLKAKGLDDESKELQAAYKALPKIEVIIEPLVDGKPKAKPYTWKSPTHTEPLTRDELNSELVALHALAPNIQVIIHAHPTTKYATAIQSFAEIKNLGFKYFKFINFQ